jgi:uncharacterized protein YecE (DUF72 family)
LALNPDSFSKQARRTARLEQTGDGKGVPISKAQNHGALVHNIGNWPAGRKGETMIYVGIGGWTFEPWRGSFYPPGLSHARELEYASRKMTAIEINGTFYRTQKPDTFRKWAEETADGFVFSVKAPRYAVNKRVLAEAGSSIERFLESGLDGLGEKLGPILWQFPPTKKFDPADFAAFLKLLPSQVKGRPLRHALEVRHGSFNVPEFLDLAAAARAAIVIADSDDYPLIEAQTANFTYARLMKSQADLPAGYGEKDLQGWAQRAKSWTAKGGDAFVFFINGAKERAPAAAHSFLGLIAGSNVS